MQIPLTALMLCNDAQALGAIERTFEEYGIPAYFCQTAKLAQSSLNRRKFDLVVLDFDEPGASELVDFQAMDVRGIPSVIIAPAEDPAMLRQIRRRRVHFPLPTPAPALIAPHLKPP